MWVADGFATVDRARLHSRGSIVTIGNFDGVHLGHQALVSQIVTLAQAQDLQSVVYTFDPHPVRILNPKLAPPVITPRQEKLRLLEALGVDGCVVEPFNRDLAALSPDEWVERALVGALHMKVLVVGYDFTYGKAGAGNAITLAAAASRLGFLLQVITQQTFSGVVASSTKVREFVLEGNVDGAELLLGRRFSLVGAVEHGDARGRSMGFPTANLAYENELLPRYGVYACWIELEDGQKIPAVTNIGVRPTVSEGAVKPSVEAHLLDWKGDLYGKRLRMSFVARLREERRFPSLPALQEQIALDVAAARQALA